MGGTKRKIPSKQRRVIKRRSGLEDEIEAQLKKHHIKYSYEPEWGKIDYTVPATQHKYTPDFYITTKSGKTIIIECKGIWVFEDRYKHLLIRRNHPELDIRFVFSNPNAKIRKGSKVTYADICDGKGRGMFKDVKWQYARSKIPTSWLQE